jgi:hypothetical protein
MCPLILKTLAKALANELADTPMMKKALMCLLIRKALANILAE